MKWLQFNARPGMPVFDGPGGSWRNGQAKRLDDNTADRLLNLYQSPFVEVPDPEQPPSSYSDRMIYEAPLHKNGAEISEENVSHETIDDSSPLAAASQIPPVPAETSAKELTTPGGSEPIQEPGESNSHYRKRLRAWRENHQNR